MPAKDAANEHSQMLAQVPARAQQRFEAQVRPRVALGVLQHAS